MFESDLVYPFFLFFLAASAQWVYIHQICFSLISIYTAKRRMHRATNKLPRYPGVSIIKPLRGCDPCLRDNLVSHFTVDYPEFELLFCFHDENDPAIDLVHSLCAEYPLVQTKIFIGGLPGTVNPMVENMAPAYAAAQYDLVWISSSRIFVSTSIMLDLVSKALDPDVALVHQPPFFADQPGFLGALEKVCFGCSISRNQIALNQLGIVCFVGMSYIIRKSLLDGIGGLSYYGKYLAEDFFISNKLYSIGYRVVLSDFPAIQNVAVTSVSAYTVRMVRWLRLRLCMIPVVAGLLEPLSEVITVGAIFAISLNYLFGTPIWLTLLGHFVYFLTADYILLRAVQNAKLPFSVLTYVLAWFTRELLVYVIFLKALWNPSKITWGRYTYKLQLGGLTSRLPVIETRRSHKRRSIPPERSSESASHSEIVYLGTNGRLFQNSSDNLTDTSLIYPSSETVHLQT